VEQLECGPGAGGRTTANSDMSRNDTARTRWLKVGRNRRLVTELAFRRLYASLMFLGSAD